MTYKLPFNKSNLPKQLFINNEVSPHHHPSITIHPSPSIHPPPTNTPQFVDSKNTRKLEVRNPKDASLVANDIALAGEADVEAAVEAASAAFKTWRKTSAKQRRDLLNRLADLIDANAEAIAELTRVTLGAPMASFGTFEVALAAESLRYFAGFTDKFPGEVYPEEDGFLKIVRNEPLGVCAGIVPWNGPSANVGMKAGPALATGNVFILKPSEKTPFSALALAALAKEAGFPPGVFQVLPGDGSTGALLASHMKIGKVSFTGSTATGRKIQEMAAKSNLKRVTLELGGKSPAVVFDDADLENAITWCVNAITANTGQVCFAASRVYVQEGIYDKFVEGYKAAMEQRATLAGDPDAEGTILGPLVDKSQFERVSGFLERGKSQGTLLTGGGRIGTDVSLSP
jgi:aldehyde dehydrogenase (NAD+)